MPEWKGVHYNDSDMLHMQQEAIRRVRQMQQRARRTVEGEPIDVDYQPVPEPPPSPPPPRPAPPPAPPHAPHPQPGRHPPPPPQQNAGLFGQLGQLGNSLGLGGIGEKLSGLFSGGDKGDGEKSGNFLTDLLGEDSPISKVLDALNIDNERLILIGLLLVLLNEKADHTLLIALVYLLL